MFQGKQTVVSNLSGREYWTTDGYMYPSPGQSVLDEIKESKRLDEVSKIETGLRLQTEGLRYDEGKNRLDLIPPEWEWELGRVLTEGAKKYADRNWELGMDYSKVVGPLRRHLNAYLRGERIDPTDGTYHAAKVAWNALVLMTYDLRKIGKDNVTAKHQP